MSASSSIIVQGFSKPDEVKAGMVGSDVGLATERAWYKDAERFQTYSDVLAAVACAKLVPIEADGNIQLSGRLHSKNPDVEKDFPAYLTPHAAQNMTELGHRWREVADGMGVPETVRLAATSLVRTQVRQDLIVASGKFAVPDSTHVAGGAYDFDLAGYYQRLSDGREAAVSLRPVAPQLTIAEAFGSEYGITDNPPVRLGPEHYDHRVTAALLIARKQMLQEGSLAGLVEMPTTLNTSLHVAAAPAA
jgi:hypothetical protein